MENTNLSEEAKALRELELDIISTDSIIQELETQLVVKRNKLERLKERKKSLLNYLNTDNN